MEMETERNVLLFMIFRYLRNATKLKDASSKNFIYVVIPVNSTPLVHQSA